MTGPRAMGIRRTREWTDTPIVRFSWGSARETRLIVAGSEIAVQERKKPAPIKTASQWGKRMTMR